MMMATLAVLLGTASVLSGVAVALSTLGARIRKPPVAAPPAGWMPVLAAADLTQHLGTLVQIEAIRTKTGLSPANFERDYGQTLGRFMAFVQLLPASESHHHAQPGGLLLHALETADIALHLRRAQVLPPGVAPEDIQRREHRWTFGVFLAALLHDVGKTLADMRVILAKRRGEGTWSPLAGDMAACGGLRYRVTFDGAVHAVGGLPGGRDYTAHQRLGVFLMQRLVPQSTLAWMAEDAELLAQFTAFLAGEDKTGVLARIVIEADRESVRRNLLEGPRTRFASARAVPLIERLMEALRRMLAEGGCLPLNRPGAAGFVADGCVWFVSKRLADEVRAYLAAHESAAGIPGPEKNDRLFDVWQEYGALIPNPDSGGAIWRVRVRMEGFDQVLTLLRFPLDKLYAEAERYPARLAGQVTPLMSTAEVVEEFPRQGTGQAAIDLPVADVMPGVTAASSPEGDSTLPAAEGDTRLPPMSSPDRDGMQACPPQEDFLETESDIHHFLPSPLVSGRIAPMRLPDKPDRPARAKEEKSARNAPQAPSEAALRFMAWLQQALAGGTIAYNETGAMVHFSAEGMLLVSPRIFRHFAERFGEKGDGTPSTLAADKLGTSIQREVIKAGWHMLGPRKTNVHRYQVVRRSGQTGSSLSVMIIRAPQRFIEPVPPANPHLVKVNSGPNPDALS
jgi:integrating conjugative element relaxase (TIGR03760 family)